MRQGLGAILYLPLAVRLAEPIIPHYLLHDGAGTQNLATIYLHRFITTAQSQAWIANREVSIGSLWQPGFGGPGSAFIPYQINFLIFLSIF